jgi:hypothetical protein
MLDISGYHHELVVTSKITFPLIQTLRLNNTGQFGYFARLILLRSIYIACWDKLIEFNDLFDPKTIVDLEIADINSFEVFPINLFTNLISLK